MLFVILFTSVYKSDQFMVNLKVSVIFWIFKRFREGRTCFF